MSSTDYRNDVIMPAQIYDQNFMGKKLDFPQWLQDQMTKRGWSQSELSKRSKVNRQVIWSYLNSRRDKPDEDILRKLADAFELPYEEIYRAAGMLPPVPEADLLTKTIVHLLDGLNQDEKSEILEYVKLRRRLSRKNQDND